jgi:hypothetical protein
MPTFAQYLLGMAVTFPIVLKSIDDMSKGITEKLGKETLREMEKVEKEEHCRLMPEEISGKDVLLFANFSALT